MKRPIHTLLLGLFASACVHAQVIVTDNGTTAPTIGPEDTGYTGTTNNRFGWDSGESLGQTFTVPNAGTIDSIYLGYNAFDDGDTLTIDLSVNGSVVATGLVLDGDNFSGDSGADDNNSTFYWMKFDLSAEDVNVITGAAANSFTMTATAQTGNSWALAPRFASTNFYGGGVYSYNGTSDSGRDYAFAVTVEPLPSSGPQIASITSLGGDLWELTLEGPPSTAFEFRSDPDLVFDPGDLVLNLTQGDVVSDPGTIGGPGDSLVTTDAEGLGKVRLSLTGPRNFVRAQTPVPLLPPPDEDGYDLWLRYGVLDEPTQLSSYQGALSAIVPAGTSATIAAATSELAAGLSGLLDQAIPVEASPSGPGALLIGTPANSATIASLIPAVDLADLGDEGYLIREVTLGSGPGFVITGNSDIGVLYGSYAFLRQIQTGTPLVELPHSSNPRNGLRLLNHWDNLSGSVERGYAGNSLWKWAQLPGTIDPRYADYARANASIGINGTVLNNVNANADILTTSYLQKVAALADVFRPYGIRVYLSAKFSAPISIGGLSTADPNNSAVRQWWADKADEIYGLIPDFGGFLVKANSEGQPGPLDYGRTHAEGANCLALALQPHGGLLIWRAFVYAYSGDRVKEAYTEFMPLDGDFEANVMIQVKNGPLDFQPREPISPLFGGMEQTNMALELQITQEYLGHSTHMVYLGPMWEEALDFDTDVAPGATLARVIDGTVHNRPLSLIAGVANTGSNTNWCGHQMLQANWYAFGRFAWDPDLSSEGILDEWIPMTFGLDGTILTTLKPMLMQSHQRYCDYTMPLGLNVICEGGPHYDPSPATRTSFHQADSVGLGYDRTTSGSDAVSQYSSSVAATFNDLATCPEEYLLWFHHVPWNHTLSSGNTLIQELFDRYDTWDDTGQWYLDNWNSLQGRIDNQRFTEVEAKLNAQKAHAKVWRDVCVGYFSTVSGTPYE